MTARANILGKLSQKLGTHLVEKRQKAAEIRLNSRQQTAPIPHIGHLEGRERVERFINQAQAVQAFVEQISYIEDLPLALSNALDRDAAYRQVPCHRSIRMGQEALFQPLDWQGLQVSYGPGRLEEPATLSHAVSAVAETGTLVLLSGPANPVTLTFLGETHYVTVFASQIEAGLEGVWLKLRAKAVDPRTVNLVTGPSRTGDIEQKIELGAHGPTALHIFLIEDL